MKLSMKLLVFMILVGGGVAIHGGASPIPAATKKFNFSRPVGQILTSLKTFIDPKNSLSYTKLRLYAGLAERYLEIVGSETEINAFKNGLLNLGIPEVKIDVKDTANNDTIINRDNEIEASFQPNFWEQLKSIYNETLSGNMVGKKNFRETLDAFFDNWAEYALEGTSKPTFNALVKVNISTSAGTIETMLSKLPLITDTKLATFFDTENLEDPDTGINKIKTFISTDNNSTLAIYWTLTRLASIYSKIIGASEQIEKAWDDEYNKANSAIANLKNPTIAENELFDMMGDRDTEIGARFKLEAINKMHLALNALPTKPDYILFQKALKTFLKGCAKYMLIKSAPKPSYNIFVATKLSNNKTIENAITEAKPKKTEPEPEEPKKPEPEEPKKVEPKEAEDLTTELQDLTNALAELENHTKKE